MAKYKIFLIAMFCNIRPTPPYNNFTLEDLMSRIELQLAQLNAISEEERKQALEEAINKYEKEISEKNKAIDLLKAAVDEREKKIREQNQEISSFKNEKAYLEYVAHLRQIRGDLWSLLFRDGASEWINCTLPSIEEALKEPYEAWRHRMSNSEAAYLEYLANLYKMLGNFLSLLLRDGASQYIDFQLRSIAEALKEPREAWRRIVFNSSR